MIVTMSCPILPLTHSLSYLTLTSYANHRETEREREQMRVGLGITDCRLAIHRLSFSLQTTERGSKSIRPFCHQAEQTESARPDESERERECVWVMRRRGGARETEKEGVCERQTKRIEICRWREAKCFLKVTYSVE